MLLSFTVRNHRSIRDRAELRLTSTRLRTERPPGGDWRPFTTRVAAIYGANASGKSAVMHALHFMQSVIQHSATTWGSNEGFPYHPFLLDDVSSRKSSEYELDFALKRVRYTYGFESDAKGIRGEWLFSYPEGRRRSLFERCGPKPEDINFGRKLSGENIMISKLLRPNGLYLSTAVNNNHPVLADIWNFLARHIGFFFVDEVNLNGADKGPKRLEIGDESSGTVSWLSRAMPAIIAIRKGGVFIVDEIDANLHPRLSAALIELFKDEELNDTGAQLIFTSHDTTLLGGLLGNVTSHDEIWFVEKTKTGISKLYSLAEFPVHSDHNIERRYLTGRYGAAPVVTYQMLRDLLKGELPQPGKTA